MYLVLPLALIAFLLVIVAASHGVEDARQTLHGARRLVEQNERDTESSGLASRDPGEIA
jgi:hypothetical protein